MSLRNCLPSNSTRRAASRLRRCAVSNDSPIPVTLTTRPPAVTSLPAAERDVIDYVRQLARTNQVAQPVFDRMRTQHGVTGLVELTCLTGHYGIVSAILNAFEVAPAPDAERLDP